MSRRRNIIAFILVAASSAFFIHTMLDGRGWPRREKARSDLETLRAENDARERRVQELRAEVQALRGRPDVQERVIRAELGFVREGDVVLEIERPR